MQFNFNGRTSSDLEVVKIVDLPQELQEQIKPARVITPKNEQMVTLPAIEHESPRSTQLRCNDEWFMGPELQVGCFLAAEFEVGVWDVGTVSALGVAPARRCDVSAVAPLGGGHVSAEVTFLDGEVEWHDFDVPAGHMDVSDGWVKFRFVTRTQFNEAHALGESSLALTSGDNVMKYLV